MQRFGYDTTVTPFILAVFCEFWQAADMLLEKNAEWHAIADPEWTSTFDCCSMEHLLAENPNYQFLLQYITKSRDYPYLGKAFKGWKVRHLNVDLG